MGVGQSFAKSDRHEKMFEMFALRPAQGTAKTYSVPELVEGGMEMIWLFRQVQDIASTSSGTDLI